MTVGLSPLAVGGGLWILTFGHLPLAFAFGLQSLASEIVLCPSAVAFVTNFLALGLGQLAVGRWPAGFRLWRLASSLPPVVVGCSSVSLDLRHFPIGLWHLVDGLGHSAFGLRSWAIGRRPFAVGMQAWVLGLLLLGAGVRQLTVDIKPCEPWPLASGLSALTFGPRASSRASVWVPMGSMFDSG